MLNTPNLNLKKPEDTDIVDISDLNENADILDAAVTLKAPLASPAFTGTVTLPATTSIGPVSATELGYLDGVTSGIQAQLSAKAPLASPALSGVPTAPTAAKGTKTTQLATTAFVQNELADTGETPVSLQPGQQIVTVPAGVPNSRFRLADVRGRTLVNLLGRDGNCEDTAKFIPFQVTHGLDATNKTTGTNGLRITLSAASGISTLAIKPAVAAGKYYILVVDAKVGNATNTRWRVRNSADTATLAETEIITSTSFTTGFALFQNAAETAVTINAVTNGASGQTAYADAIRLFEVTQAEYDARATMTAEQIATKYPYVDDMKPVSGLYAIRRGENLLPPFTEWSDIAAQAIIVEPYRLDIVATGSLLAYTTPLIPVVPDQQYTYAPGDALPTGAAVDVVGFDANGIGAGFDGPNTSGGNAVTVTIPTNVRYVRFRAIIANTVPNGTLISFIRPTLNLGSTAKPFVPRNDDILILPTTLASSVDGSVYDSIGFDDDGQYVKHARFRTIELDGSLPWAFMDDQSGFKRIRLPTGSLGNVGQWLAAYMVKFDGKPLSQYLFGESGTFGADYFVVDNRLNASTNEAYIHVPDADSGWPESWAGTPFTQATYPLLSRDATAQEVIKIWAYGWKWDNVGTRWVDRINSDYWTRDVDNALHPSQAFQRRTLTPYRLQYQLALPVVELIEAEGSIALLEGPNQIEVGAGAVVREPAPFFLDTNDGRHKINHNLLPASLLPHRVERLLDVYEDASAFYKHIISRDNLANGKERISILPQDFSTASAYSVTYIAETYQVSAVPVKVVGAYESSLASTIKANVLDIADLTRRVSVVERVKANRQQGQWIAPTLINGWVNNGSYGSSGYFKDELSMVYFKGLLQSGVTSTNTVLFILPVGYRPKNHAIFTVYSSLNSFGIIQINSNGNVLYVKGDTTTGFISLNGITFRAEQ